MLHQSVVFGDTTSAWWSACESGGNGRRSGLRNQYLRVCGFDSHGSHHGSLAQLADASESNPEDPGSNPGGPTSP